MPSIMDPCELCKFYTAKLREINDNMSAYKDISGFGKWEFYLGKMLDEPFQDEEAESIKGMLCKGCPSLSIYSRGYLKELKGVISKTGENIQTCNDELRANIIRSCVPILDNIISGNEILFDVVYKDVGPNQRAIVEDRLTL